MIREYHAIKMFSKRRTTNIIIISIFCLVLLFGSNTILDNEIVEKIRTVGIGIFPLAICISIILDIRKEIKSILKQKQTIICVALLIWLLVSIAFAIKIGTQSIKGMLHFGALFGTVILMANARFSEEDKIKIKNAIFISAIICAIYGVFQYISGIKLNTMDNAKYPGIRGRINSTFYIATILDKFFVVIILLSVIEILRKETELIPMLSLIFSTIGLTLTFSRTGQIIFLGIIFISIIASIILKKYKCGILFFSMIIIMLLIPGTVYSIQSALDQAYWQLGVPKQLRFNIAYWYEGLLTGELPDQYDESDNEKEQEENEDVSASFRDYYNSIGKQFLIENKVNGIGLGNYSYLYNNQNAIEYLNKKSIINEELDMKYPHSGYYHLGAEIGFIGLVLTGMFFISTIFYNNSKGDKVNSIILLGLFLLLNYPESLIYNKQYAYVFAIIYGLYISNSLVKNKDRKKAIFISSTGGHFSEMMMLKPMFDDFDYNIITEKTNTTKSLKDTYGNRIDFLVYGTKDHKFKYIFKLAYNIIKSFILFIKIRPDIVITTGTHTAVPMCYIAHLFRRKVVFIETFANVTTPTMSGKMVYKIADLFVVQWEEMKEIYPNAVYLGGVF